MWTPVDVICVQAVILLLLLLLLSVDLHNCIQQDATQYFMSWLISIPYTDCRLFILSLY